MGSEYFMLYEDLDKVGRHNDILVVALCPSNIGVNLLTSFIAIIRWFP
jgi:hypothetical protein